MAVSASAVKVFNKVVIIFIFVKVEILIIILKQIQLLSKVKSNPDAFSYLLFLSKYFNKRSAVKNWSVRFYSPQRRGDR